MATGEYKVVWVWDSGVENIWDCDSEEDATQKLREWYREYGGFVDGCNEEGQPDPDKASFEEIANWYHRHEEENSGYAGRVYLYSGHGAEAGVEGVRGVRE